MLSWIGKSIVFIGIVHSVFGFVAFRSTLAGLVADGVFNTIDDEINERSVAFWFLVFGFMVIIAGLVTDWCERTVGSLPGFLGWVLLAFTVLFVIIMPKSGAWLLFVPAIGAIWRSF